MQKSYFSSLGFRLLILVLIVALPIFGLILFIDADQRQKATASAEANLTRYSKLNASDLGQVIEGAKQLGLALSEVEAVQEHDSGGCSAIFMRLLIENPIYSNLSVSDPNGDVFCSGVPLSGPTNLADRPHFRDALRYKQFTIGSYVVSRTANQSTIPFAYPILDRGGEVRAVLTILLDLHQLSVYGQAMNLPEGSVYLLTDRAGTILTRFPDPNEWVGLTVTDTALIGGILNGGEGVLQASGLDGVNRLYGYAPVSGSGRSLYVAVGIPEAVVLADSRATTTRNLVVLGLTSLVAILIATQFSRSFILTPVLNLVEMARRITSGDLSARVPPAVTSELDWLGSSFNQMAGGLEEQTGQLQRAERNYRTLVEHIPAITYRIRLLAENDLSIEYVSPQVESLLGIPVADVRREPGLLIDAIHPDDRAQVEARLSQNIPGDAWAQEFRMHTRDGRTLWFRDEGKAIRDESSGTVGLHGVMFNVTERHKMLETLRQERDLFERLMETSPAGILVFDITGDIIYANHEAEDSLGLPYQELIGTNQNASIWRSLDEQGNPIPKEKLPFDLVMAAREPLAEYHLSIQPEGKDRIHLSVNAAPFRDGSGDINGVIVTLQDITELTRQHKNMESMVTLTTALRNATNRTDMYAIVLGQVLDLLKFDGAALATIQQPNRELVFPLGLGVWTHLTGVQVSPGEGITSRVISSGEIYRNDRIREDSDLILVEGFFSGDIVSGACVPLRIQGQVIGAIWVGDHSPIGDHDLAYLTAIADIAANAIHRATLFEQTQSRLKRLSALHAVDMAITSSLDLQVTLSILLDQVVGQLNVDAASILLLDPDTQMLEYAAGRGFISSKVQQTRLHLGERYAGEVALNRRPEIIPDIRRDNGEVFPIPNENFLAYFAEPLLAKGQVKGVLEVFQRSVFIPDEEWLEFFQSLATQAAIAIDSTELFNKLQRTNDELTLAYDATIEGWSRALELRDGETEGHSERVTDLTLRIAKTMGVRDHELSHYRRGVLLHDIGKMGIPEEILMKPGPLTQAEWDVMHMHPRYAYELLYPVPFLRQAVDIPYCHHERWDGSGYPRGLRGESIPLAARIFAVVDVWDALCSIRPFRNAWPQEQAETYLRTKSGMQFDPRVIATFFDIIKQRYN